MNKNKVILAIIVLLVDQISKIIVFLNKIDVTVIKNFFSISYCQNEGAAWSLFQGKTVFLIILTILSLILIYNIMFSFKENKLSNLCFGLIFGGVLGNLVDRVFYGYVRDFLSFRIFNYNYPVFNIADMAIVIGIFILIILSIKGDESDGSKRFRKRIKN